MMDSPWVAALAALFLWWFSTGIILMRVRAADNAGHDQHIWSCILSLPLLAAGVFGVNETLALATPTGAFAAFLSAMAIWGWIELAFLSGVITGPNRQPCPPGTSDRERFLRGAGTLAWHELALVAALLALVHMTRGAANDFAMWTFAVLFFARVSAKLNLFFGVPRIHTEFLPRTLSHLPSHFRRGGISWFFPVSISVLSFAAYCMLDRLWQAGTAGQETGFALLLALTLLALLEHWFMVVPLPDQKLWRWMMAAPKPMTPDPVAKD